MTTSSAEQHLRTGNPALALAELQKLVKKEPANARHRIFLFQLFSVLGQWERAKTQLHVVRDLDHSAIPMVQTYREALRCEVLREEVFAGKRSPLVFGEPAQWVAAMVQALSLSAQGDVEQAQAMRAAALEDAVACGGTITIGGGATADGEEGKTSDTPFAWLADADTRLGPLLEAIINGKYYWVPCAAVTKVDIDPPADLRDMIWMPATFQWQNGGSTVALLPARYVGSAEAADPLLQLGRRTEWVDAGSDEFRGLGQKVVATDGADFGLCDVRRIVFASSD